MKDETWTDEEFIATMHAEEDAAFAPGLESPAETQPAPTGEVALKAEEALRAYAVLLGTYQRRRDEVLSTIRHDLDAIEYEFGDTLAIAEKAVKAAVLAGGETVKAGGLHAIITAGRVTWDSKKLDGYMAAHPELARFRKVSPPSVTIRNAK